MSKRKLISIAIILAALLVVILFAVSLASRRSHIIGDETYTEDTEAPSETLSPDEQYPAEIDWIALFEKYGNLRSESGATNSNTPFFYYWESSQYSDTPVFSKTAQTLDILCKEAFCTHETCIFSDADEWFLRGVAYLNGRIYFLQDQITDLQARRLCSTDLHLNDPKIEWEQSKGLESMQADGDRLYFEETVYDENGTPIYNTVSWYDPASRDSGFVSETLHVKNYIVRNDRVYVLQGRNKVVCCRVDDPTISTLLELELKDTQQIILEYVDDQYLVYTVMSGYQIGEPQRCQLDTGEVSSYYDMLPQGYTYLLGENFVDQAFLCIDHSGEAYAEDPYYDFYTDMYTTEITLNKSLMAGRIYTLTNEGKLRELVQLTTDGIPDLIWNILDYDGRYLYVTYQTYKDYRNEYNPEGDLRNSDWHLAVIDTQTGQGIKPCEAETTQE